jgi:hypothetical protein
MTRVIGPMLGPPLRAARAAAVVASSARATASGTNESFLLIGNHLR